MKEPEPTHKDREHDARESRASAVEEAAEGLADELVDVIWDALTLYMLRLSRARRAEAYEDLRKALSKWSQQYAEAITDADAHALDSMGPWEEGPR